MFTVYVLYSKQFDKIYIGFTSDLDARITAHNHPANKGWTKKYMPWVIVYTEEFEEKTDAIKREKELKSSRGRDFIRKAVLK